MAWYLNPALTRFREAVNAAYPLRDKASDGTIGDEAHQATASDHNPDADGSVDAWDMDVNLRTADDAAAIEALKDTFEAHPASRYWIHNRQIATRSNGWRREPYTGANPHTQHVHWNSRESHENSTTPWEVDPMPTADEIAAAVWAHKHTNPVTKQPQAKGTVLQYMDAVHDEKARIVLERLDAVEQRLADLPAPGTVVITDEQLERVLRKVYGSLDAT
ncbi:hypothetical protein [Phytohabitans aurantiacus]|uniref:Uncharacterized protein n=1 Tax=Phytohabitans aurantiacus TaxID=3016789 RepID=A0ABQ5R0N4_9ACTN|nr:hypothetical protein [Phytohabitans aurantiacus]GLI00301.1 hypothetical protein Pa4123_55770 [Phytohabitans aurantiacus]